MIITSSSSSIVVAVSGTSVVVTACVIVILLSVSPSISVSPVDCCWFFLTSSSVSLILSRIRA